MKVLLSQEDLYQTLIAFWICTPTTDTHGYGQCRYGHLGHLGHLSPGAAQEQTEHHEGDWRVDPQSISRLGAAAKKVQLECSWICDLKSQLITDETQGESGIIYCLSKQNCGNLSWSPRLVQCFTTRFTEVKTCSRSSAGCRSVLCHKHWTTVTTV